MDKLPEWVWKSLALLIIPTVGAFVSLQIKHERLEAKFDALKLDELPALVQENHELLLVQGVQYDAQTEKIDIIMDLIRNAP